MISDEPVVVVGAGIAGLAAATALADRGFGVLVVEHADELGEVGAGIQIPPNALRVLDRLGVRPHLHAAVEARTVSLRRFRSGARVAEVPVQGADGTPYLSALRSDLQAALLAAARSRPSIQIHTGNELTALRADCDAMELTIRASRGRYASQRTRRLIAADGIRSTVGTLVGHAEYRLNGYVAWRLTVDAAVLPVATVTNWLGAGCHLVAYPIAAGQRTNIVFVLPAGELPIDRLKQANEQLVPLANRFEAAKPYPLGSAERRRGAGDPPGLLFIGDAAHAMPPYAAQGAALAIEDGFVAAACLADAPDAAAAWRRFEASRAPRWARLRRRVAFHSMIYHLPPPLAIARDAALRLRSPAALSRDLAWLYDWHPPA